MASRAEAKRLFNHQARQTHFLPRDSALPGLPSGLPHPFWASGPSLPEAVWSGVGGTSLCDQSTTPPPPRGPWGGGQGEALASGALCQDSTSGLAHSAKAGGS